MTRKLLHLITSLEGGGTENFLYQVIAHSPPGYEHQVVYLKKDGVIGERLRGKNIPVKRAPSVTALYHLLGVEQPALLHTCLYSAHILGRIVGRLSHAPAIVTSQRAIDLWQQPWQNVLDRWTLPLSDAVIANSHAAADLTERRRGKRPRPLIFEIPNGVDTTLFKPGDRTAARRHYTLPADALVGGALLRLHREKGADFIPQWARALLPQVPHLHLLIGGVGPFEASLKAALKGESFQDRIHWIGWEKNAPLFLSACDFVWSLSREESFPQSLVEASLMGLPWVAPQVGGVSRLIDSGATGAMYPRLDIPAAAEHTQQLIHDLPTLTGQAHRALPTLQKDYSLETMIQQVYSVFDRLISQASGRV